VIALAIATAIAIPLLFLYLIYALDLYSSGSFQAVASCFIWGLISFFLAYLANRAALSFVSITLLVVLVAPILEEVFKSLSLVYYVRKPDFIYFVDGAIYGFASGIAFSIFENFFYLAQSPRGGGALILSRAFSTCLMHGSASALVGISIGRLRFGQGATRVASVLLGWTAAMALHSSFNRVVNAWSGTQALLAAIAIGLGGVGLIALFIRWGLREERGWIEETLGLQLGVTAGEVEVVKRLDSLDTLLVPVAARFGREKAEMVRVFLVKQAQLGIKQKSRELAHDERLRKELAKQIEILRGEMEDLRRKVGVYCMIYVRSIFPQEAMAIWSRLEELVGEEQESRVDLWDKLEDALNR
jgi:RsiW-degrading membrane proteinase PrsW (M82 family)